MKHNIHLFAEIDFDGVQEGRRRDIIEEVNREDAEYLLNVNETQYVDHLNAKHHINELTIDFDRIEATPVERSVPAEHFPRARFHVRSGEHYTKPAFVYHVPFSGDKDLLRCIPNPRTLMTYAVDVNSVEFSFEIIDFYGDAARVKQRADEILEFARTESSALAANVRQFNQGLPEFVKAKFSERKAAILKQRQCAANLGVPIRRNPNVASTFAVPATTRKVVPARPVSSPGPYRPDPTINDAIYGDILQTIQDTGRMFERLPSVYAEKDEESLRDHFLVVLEPHFQITTTGETFNKAGKTDILMRYEGQNVFVAECKFWGGAKKHHQTIDQILSYLTFRDSKTAIIYFMDTKEMTAPPDAINESTPQHACYVTAKGRRDETWFNYEFHLPGDPGRSLQLAMLCFHLPKV